MPITSKGITVNLVSATSGDTEFGVLLNKNTGDIWHMKAQSDTILFDLANNNYLGDEPSQWVVGHVLEYVIFGSDKKVAGTHILTAGVNEIDATMATDTAVEVNL